MEDRYLEYDQTGYVIKIHVIRPTELQEGHKIAILSNSNYDVGSEYDNFLIVQEVDENDKVTSMCGIKQPESAKFLRRERDRLQLKSEEIINTQAQVVFALVMGGLM